MLNADPPRISVAAALELPELRRGLPQVVAGAGNLDRRIRWVHAGEVPNIATLLRGGELLLTTGMGIGKRAADQRNFVDELASHRVAALVVELGNTWSRRLPSALVAAAERQGLPVVELHAEVPFVAVTEAIHTAIVNEHYNLLRRAEELQVQFTALMLEGDGIPGVLQLLAETVGNPVFLEGSDGQLLHMVTPSGSEARANAVAAWSSAVRDEGAPGLTVPIPLADARGAARLVVLPLEAPLDAIAVPATERAAGAVALAFLRTRQENELLAHGRGELLRDMATGGVTPDHAAERARTMGFEAGEQPTLLPFVAQLDMGRSAFPRRPGEPRSWPLVRDIERGLLRLGLPMLVGLSAAEGLILVLLALRDGDERIAIAEAAAGAIHQAVDAAGGEAVVAVGAVSSWDTAGRDMRRTMHSAAAATRLPSAKWHDATAMALERLLWGFREQDALEAYVSDLLGRVLAHDADRKHQLLPTLEALCVHGGRKTETARTLHVNRQGLYARIARLERILEVDLSDTRTILALHLALTARRYTRT